MSATVFDVATGYKQTEVGVIPDDWKVAHLGDVAHITTGRKDVNEGNPTGAYPFFTCSRAHTFSDHYSFDTEAILIAGNGDVGNLHYYAGRFEAYQRTYVVSGFGANVRFVWQQLDYRLIESLGIGTIGSSIPYIKKENLTSFAFPLPPTSAEQEAIAEALGDADALIESLEQLVAKKRHLKQAAMQQLLTGKKRLPGFEGEWQTKSVGSLVELVRNGAVYKPDMGGRSRITRIETISDGVIDFGRTGIFGYAREFADYRMAAGDILFSHINSVEHIGKTAIYDGARELFHGMNLLLIRVNDSTSPKFLHQLLNLTATRQRLRALAKQAVSQASINTAELKAFELFVPLRDEQAAIAHVLTDMDADIEALEAKLAKARQIKQGMMQELLTGRTRLI